MGQEAEEVQDDPCLVVITKEAYSLWCMKRKWGMKQDGPGDLRERGYPIYSSN